MGKIKKVEPEFEAETPKGAVNLANNSNCFVVTVVTGSSNSDIVNEFRYFRYAVLHQNKFGLKFSKLYNKYGPYFANAIRDNETLKVAVKFLIIKPAYFVLMKTKKFYEK